jgi:hypothetical protein
LALVHLPDVNSAVECFLANFRKLKYLPFITDIEAKELFGPQVTASLVELENYNQQEQICSRCQGRCCLRVKCEVYDASFGGCAVESLRPVLCRLHFCDKFKNGCGPLAKILGDIYLESLLAAAKIDSVFAGLFDCPTFLPLAPHLVSRIMPLLDDARTGGLPERQAFLDVRHLILTNPTAMTSL